jgi:hypothetical protein
VIPIPESPRRILESSQTAEVVILDPLGLWLGRSDIRFLGKRLRLRRRHARFLPRQGVRLLRLGLRALTLRI